MYVIFKEALEGLYVCFKGTPVLLRIIFLYSKLTVLGKVARRFLI